jgi:hypothetical protein
MDVVDGVSNGVIFYSVILQKIKNLTEKLGKPNKNKIK